MPVGSASHVPQPSAPSTSAVAPSFPHRKRGRPKGAPKPLIYGPNPRRGRPPGTGYKQRQGLVGQGGATRQAARPRGRPKKQVSESAISIEFGKVVSRNILYALISYLNLFIFFSWHLGHVHGMWMLINRPDMAGLPFLMV